MGPLKLAPNVAPSQNIGINNGVDARTPVVVNTPDPRGVAVPGGPTITNWSGPAQTWSTPPTTLPDYMVFGRGLHGFGRGTLRNFLNFPFRIGTGEAQIANGNFKQGAGNIVGGVMDGPAWFIGGGEAKGAQAGLKGLSTAAKILKLAKTGAKVGGAYGAGQGFADSASNNASAKDILKSTAEGGAIGAASGAALGPAGAGAIKAASKAPDAANLIKNLVMPNATHDKFYDTVARHVISTGALQHDAEQKAAAGMDALSNAENKAVTTGELNHQLPAPSGSHMLPSGTQDANLLPAGPKALPAGNRFTTEHSTAVLEGNAKLVRQYTRDRNRILRKYAGDLRNPALQKQLDTLQKRYINKQKFMASQIDKQAARDANAAARAEKVQPVEAPAQPVEKTPVVSTKVEKPKVAQSSAPEVVKPAEVPPTAPSEIPQGLTNTTKGNKARSQNSVAQKVRYGGYSPEVTQHIDKLYHEVQNQNMASTAAKRLVNADRQAAEEVFASGDLLKANPTAHAKLGQELMLKAAESGDKKSFNRLLAIDQEAATAQGQGLRARQLNILTPRGIKLYAAKIADRQGRKVNGEDLKTLETWVNKLNKTPPSAERDNLLMQIRDLAENRTMGTKAKDLLKGTLSIPRSIMASTDVSFALRQGAVFGARHPKIWAEAVVKSMRFAVDKKYFKQEMAKLANLTDKNGVSLSPMFKRMGLDLEAVHGRSEEIFGNTSLSESKVAKKLGVGHVIQGSDNSFSGAAAIMRAKGAKTIIDNLGGLEGMADWTTKDFKDMGRVINTATGRGHGGENFEKWGPALSQTLFSARLWKSRLDILSPVYYARLSPAARKEALQSTLAFAGLAGLALGIAKGAGASVETDMRSSDFGKIKIGNTRYDILGGLQQNLVLAWREISHQYKSSTTGNISDLNHPKFGGANRLTVLGRTVENKLAPVIAEALRQIQGNDISGKPFANATARLKDASSLGIPLNVQDTYSTARDALDNGASKGKAIEKAALGAALPGTFGVGVQTYGNNKAPAATPGRQTGNNQTPTSVADATKAYFGNTKVNYQGKQVLWTDLNNQQKSELAATDATARSYLDAEKNINTAHKTNKLYNPQLDPQSVKTLNYFDHLSAKGKQTVLARDPKAEYALKQAQFKNDMLNGKFVDDEAKLTAQKSLDKQKVASDYTQEVRHLYGLGVKTAMSKGDLENYLGTLDANRAQGLFNNLIALDDALYNAGLESSHKFRYKSGALSLSIGTGGSGSGSSGSSKSSSSKAKSTKTPKPKSVSVPHISLARASYVPRLRSSRARRSSGRATVAIKGSSRGKIKTSIKKAQA